MDENMNATLDACLEVKAEVERARAKFPRNDHLLAALGEEYGELCQALLQNQGPERVREEAIQVACVAIRIATEGDRDFARSETAAAADPVFCPKCWHPNTPLPNKTKCSWCREEVVFVDREHIDAMSVRPQ